MKHEFTSTQRVEPPTKGRLMIDAAERAARRQLNPTGRQLTSADALGAIHTLEQSRVLATKANQNSGVHKLESNQTVIPRPIKPAENGRDSQVEEDPLERT